MVQYINLLKSNSKGALHMIYVLIILLSYLLGSIPSGLIIGKLFYKKDIREYGSGNIGGTNSFRILGFRAGLAVTIADILKGTVATLLPVFFGVDTIHLLLVGFFAVIGHIFPIFAGFRGGKAVATSGGVLLAYVPLLFFLLVAVFFISLKLSKYVSLSSIITSIFAVIYTIIYALFIREPQDWPLVIAVFSLASFVIYRHKENIKRIKNKTEPKVTWL